MKTASEKKAERRLIALVEQRVQGTLDLDRLLYMDPKMRANPQLMDAVRKRIQQLVPRLRDN